MAVIRGDTREICDRCRALGIIGVPALEKLTTEEAIWFVMQEGSPADIPANDLVELVKGRTTEQLNQLIAERLPAGKAIAKRTFGPRTVAAE